MLSKSCTRCGLNKPLEEFHVDKKGRYSRSARCKACACQHVRDYRQTNLIRITKAKQEWYDANPDWKRQYAREYRKARRARDPAFKIMGALRCRTAAAIRKKKSTTIELLGCSPNEFRKHLESLWTSGMSWDNYGPTGWHIDHIKPCASFDLTDPAQQKACFHWTNCQPLWAKDNFAKSDN